MRRSGWTLAAALAFALACHKGSSGPAFRLANPSSVAVFWGYAHTHAELRPYGAVANSAQDEIVVFDAVDDTVLSSPVLIRPLSIPLAAARPALVAAGSFTPPEGDPARRPDLLVAVGAASSELQLVRTWRVADATDPGLAESAIELGGPIAALLVAPAVDADGKIVPDRARVIAALAGGQLAVVEYQWSGDPATGGGVQPVSSTPVVLTPGFEVLSLAVDPSLDAARVPRNPSFLYAATLDPIPDTNVEGVAEFDMRGDPAGWTYRGLSAGAPTRLVAAFTLQERVPDVRGGYDQVTRPSQEVGGWGSFQETAATRVYAFRDPAACGPTTDVACGVAVIDPSTGEVLEDPWHVGETPKRFLPPIAVPTTPVALVPGPPAWNPPSADTAGLESDPQHRFMLYSTAAGPRITTGVLFIPSEDGRSYYADLARWEIPSETAEVGGSGSQTRVISWVQSDSHLPRIGLLEPPDVAAADLANGATARPTWEGDAGGALYVQLTPGFTPDDVWSVTYQGYLPHFAEDRPARIEAGEAAGTLRVSLQSTSGTQVVNVHDPARGIRVGDIVEIWTVGSGSNARTSCPDTSQTTGGVANAPIEGKILEIRKPDAQHPGGVLVLEKGDCVPVSKVTGTVCDAERHGPWNDPGYAGCWASLPGPDSQQVRIRASGGGSPSDPTLDGKEFVVAGTSAGYAGRATSVPEGTAFPTFQLTGEEEAARVQACRDACPVLPYPADPLAAPDCVEEARRLCEDAAIARRARRHHLTSAYCFVAAGSPAAKNHCQTHFPQFAPPIAGEPSPPGTYGGEPPSGPVLAFSLGVRPGSNLEATILVRDSKLVFTTRSGWAPAARWGGGVDDRPSTGPMGAAYFDRSLDPSWGKTGDRYRFFVPHLGNLILDATPAHSNDHTNVMR